MFQEVARLWPQEAQFSPDAKGGVSTPGTSWDGGLAFGEQMEMSVCLSVTSSLLY